MNTLYAAVESVRQVCGGRPCPDWVRGICPKCGDAIVSNVYYVKGAMYHIIHECWSSLSEPPTCNYRKVL